LASHAPKKKNLKEDMSIQSVETIRVPILELPSGSPGKKMPFGCSPHGES